MRLLVWDLKRPDRFYYLLTKGNPGSWLVRGAWILSAFAAVVGAWFLAGVFGIDGAIPALAWAAAVLGLGLAGYTAFLFGQAEARDLWQSPTLLWHMLAGAFAAGGGFGLLAGLVFDLGETAERAFAWSMVGGAAALGLDRDGRADVPSPDPQHRRGRAPHDPRRVRPRVVARVASCSALSCRSRSAPSFLGGAELWVGALGGVGAMAGIWFADDAFVKAGQSVPLS